MTNSNPDFPTILGRLDALPATASAGLGALIGGGATLVLMWPGQLLPTVAAFGLVGLGAGLALTGRAQVRARHPATPVLGPRPQPDPVLGTSIWLPGGESWMGSPPGQGRADEQPRHRVRLSPYAMGVTPVTVGQWNQVMGQQKRGDQALPVTEVGWEEAIAFCNAASLRAGLPPAYLRQGDGWRWDGSSEGYRLPTEAEWEQACLAGGAGPYGRGDDGQEVAEARLVEFAWFDANAEDLQPVATRRANAWGLHDMWGSVWEWCWDGYDSSAYRERSVVGDPVVDNVSTQLRVVRGGSFRDSADYLRAALRIGFLPELQYVFLGFRCVRGARRQPGG